MTRPPPRSGRARLQRRAEERAARKEVRQRQRATEHLPGGTAERPMDVASASVVEVQARGVPCIQCGGELSIRGDQASSTPRGVLRELQMACRICHAPRILWFRVTPTLSS